MDIQKELAELKEKATPLNTAKFIAGTIVSCGAMAAVVALLGPTTQSTKGLTKLMMKAGIFILGCKAGEVAEKHFNDAADNLIKTLKEAEEEINKDGADTNE